jgi:hypothetical protein
MACIDPSNQLVYLRTLKCASTFFYNNFTRILGWQEIKWTDIDWHTHHVFSHMLDPIQRRHKAVAEFINICGLNTDEFLSNPGVQKFISQLPVLDNHSSSYHDLYGYACYSIDWIPLSQDFKINIRSTELLCQAYGHTYQGKWSNEHVHPGTPAKKQIEQILENLWGSHQDEWVHNYLEFDMKLYNRVISQFRYDADSWQDMSWLTGRL